MAADKIEEFSVVIIGAGSGGLTAAQFAARLGAKACLIEERHVGGDCTWTGCVPSKALIKSAKVAHHARTAADFGIAGIDSESVKADMQRVHDYVHKSIGEVAKHETKEHFESKGIRVFLGRAKFESAHIIEISPSEGSDLTRPVKIKCDRVVICTGARPIVPDFVTESGVPFITYEQIFNITELPKSLVIIGGGPIGIEMAQAYQRLGTQVSVIASRILPKEDRDAAEVLTKVLEREGLKHYKGRAEAVASSPDGGVTVTVTGGEQVTSSLLLVAAGRRPWFEGLGLENAGVEYTSKGITVDSTLKTSVSHIYAAGDCIGSAQFTHYAGWQAFMAVRNFILPSSTSGIADIIPRVTFSDPEIAAVGMSEEEFRAQYGDEGRIEIRSLEHVDRAVVEGEHHDGFYKIMYSPDQKIRGATMVSQRAGETINEIAVAMTQGITMKSLGKTIHAYPSFGFGAQQMASDVAVEGLFHGLTGRLINWLKRV
eukprot:m.67266 g.67266  ORF g.67266 m.67266 type:complete len:486 (-) comp13816_c0_seq2:55-1512(-)